MIVRHSKCDLGRILSLLQLPRVKLSTKRCPCLVENLFDQATLEKARHHRTEFIDVDPSRTRIVRGTEVLVPES